MGHFPRLTAAALDLTIDTPDFTQTITDTLGSLGTSADGFDKYLADTIPLLSAGVVFGTSLDADLGLAAGVLSLINPNSLANDVATLPASLAEGDAIVVQANALLGSTGVITTPSSGGGGGGTPAPDPLAGCQFGGTEITVIAPPPGAPEISVRVGFFVHEDDGSIGDVTAVRLISQTPTNITSVSLDAPVAYGATDPRSGKRSVGMIVISNKPAATHARFGIKTVRVPTERTQCVVVTSVGGYAGGAPAGGAGGGAPVGKPIGVVGKIGL